MGVCAYQEFKQNVLANIQLRSPFCDVEARKVVGNNGTTCEVVCLSRGDIAVKLIPLDELHSIFLSGKSVASTVDLIIHSDIYIKFNNSYLTISSDLKHYEKVADYIVCHLINYEKNKNSLNDVPHIRLLNLVIVFYLRRDTDKLEIRVTNKYIQSWGITTKDLFDFTLSKMEMRYPVCIQSFADVLDEMRQSMGLDTNSDIDFSKRYIKNKSKAGTIEMYICKNNCNYGAAVLLYKDMLRKLSEKLNRDLVIFPSSVHEAIIIPYIREKLDVIAMREMVKQVNDYSVLEEEYLSNDVYFYARKTGQMIIMK